MPNGELTIEQLGAQTKAKYPEYKDMSDLEVGQAVLKKYPQYQSLIVEKKSLSDTTTQESPSTSTESEPLSTPLSPHSEKSTLVPDFGAGQFQQQQKEQDPYSQPITGDARIPTEKEFETFQKQQQSVGLVNKIDFPEIQTIEDVDKWQSEKKEQQKQFVEDAKKSVDQIPFNSIQAPSLHDAVNSYVVNSGGNPDQVWTQPIVEVQREKLAKTIFDGILTNQGAYLQELVPSSDADKEVISRIAPLLPGGALAIPFMGKGWEAPTGESDKDLSKLFIKDPAAFKKYVADSLSKQTNLSDQDKAAIQIKVENMIDQYDMERKVEANLDKKYESEGKTKPSEMYDQFAKDIGATIDIKYNELVNQIQNGAITPEAAQQQFDAFVKEKSENGQKYFDYKVSEINEDYKNEYIALNNKLNEESYKYYDEMGLNRKIASSIGMGVNMFYETLGGGLMTLGNYNLGGDLELSTRETGKMFDAPYIEPAGVKNLKDPVWWTTSAAPNLVNSTIQMIPAATIALATGGTGIGVVGTGLVSGAASRWMEGYFGEGGSQFIQDIRSGKSIEASAERSAFLASQNQQLQLVDGIQMMLAFAPMPKINKVASIGGKMIGVGGSEYVEENVQGYWQAKLDNPQITFEQFVKSPIGVESGIQGVIGGLTLGAMGSFNSGAQGKNPLTVPEKITMVTELLEKGDLPLAKRYEQSLLTLNYLKENKVLNETEYTEAAELVGDVVKSIKEFEANQQTLNLQDDQKNEYVEANTELQHLQKQYDNATNEVVKTTLQEKISEKEEELSGIINPEQVDKEIKEKKETINKLISKPKKDAEKQQSGTVRNETPPETLIQQRDSDMPVVNETELQNRTEEEVTPPSPTLQDNSVGNVISDATPKLSSYNGIKPNNFARDKETGKVIKVENIYNDKATGNKLLEYKEYGEPVKGKGAPYELKYVNAEKYESAKTPPEKPTQDNSVVGKVEDVVSVPESNYAKSKLNVVDVPISDVNTATDVFQNRGDEFSQETVDRIKGDVKEGKFNFGKFDPVILWKNPKDSKLYVLSGHSRLQAFKELRSEGFKDFGEIPSKIIDAKDIAEAKQIAKESNVLATKEKPTERATYYQNELKSGRSKSDVLKEIKQNEGKGAGNYLFALAHLNPEGALFKALKALESGAHTESEANISTVAKWIGEVRRQIPQLTNAHETELFDWLVKEGAKKNISKESDFASRVMNIASRMDFDAEKPLNISNKVTKTHYDVEYEQRISEKEQEIRDQEKLIDSKRKGYLQNNATPDQANKLLEKENGTLNRMHQDLLKLKAEKANVKDANAGLLGLFDNIQNEIKDGTITKQEAEKFIERSSDEQIEKREPIIEDIESKKGSANETELKSVVKEADNLIQDKEPIAEKKPTLTEKTKAAADKFRRLKGKPLTIKRADGTEITITKSSFLDDAIEIGAQAIELSGKIADGIKAAVDHIKGQKWYQDLTKEDQAEVEKQVGDYFGGVDLNKPSGIKKALVPEAVVESVEMDRIGDVEMIELGRQILDSGQVNPKAVIRDITKNKKGVLTPNEVAALITYKADLDNDLAAAYKKKNKLIAEGESVGAVSEEIYDLEADINNFETMAVITAQQQSLAFRLRQQMLDRDYNIVTEIEKYKANNSGYIPPDIEKKFREMGRELGELRGAAKRFKSTKTIT